MNYLILFLLLVCLFKWINKEGLYPSRIHASNGVPNINEMVDTGTTSKALIDKTFSISTDEIDQRFNTLPLSLKQLIS